ncbi:MAG: restriction endonuclease [Fimbriimonadaceae bacterium]|nr:restriction endonuclease [Fimbriimonadaceae bacterium]
MAKGLNILILADNDNGQNIVRMLGESFLSAGHRILPIGNQHISDPNISSLFLPTATQPKLIHTIALGIETIDHFIPRYDAVIVASGTRQPSDTEIDFLERMNVPLFKITPLWDYDATSDRTKQSFTDEELRALIRYTNKPAGVYFSQLPESIVNDTNRWITEVPELILFRDSKYFIDLVEFSCNKKNVFVTDLSLPEINLVTLSDCWDEVFKTLSWNYDQVVQLSSDRFEDMVGELLSREGFEVTPTARTRDGGKDFIVSNRNILGEHLFYVEAKHPLPKNPIDVTVVRSLYGVIQLDRVNGGMIVTSNRFTRDAIDEASGISNFITLRDGQYLADWIKRHAKQP